MPPRGRVALAIACALFGAAPAARPATFDYLYIEANEGGSSGGHAAIRFGERIYHFQNRDGMLVLDRESTPDFLYAYALLANRTIRESRVQLRESDRARLLERFDRRHHAQEQQLDVLEAVREDRSLLEAWRDETPVELPGLGFFDLQRTGSNVAQALLDEIRERFAADFVPRRRAALTSELARIAATHPAAWQLAIPTDLYAEPPFEAPFARRYRGVAAGLAALQVLERRASLDESATIEPDGPLWQLSPLERERAARTAAEWRGQLVRLAGSARSDWGGAFLVGLARLEALDRSLARGRFVLLDSLPRDARLLEHAYLSKRPDVVADMIRAGHGQVASARLAWAAGDAASERDWSRLEAAANRVHELESAVRERRDLRLARGALVPSRAAPLPTPLPTARRESLDAALESVRTRETSYAGALHDLYRYRLIRRNCVSELFHTIDDGFEGDPAASVAALGGHIDGHRGGSFIPFVSARRVEREYRVVSRRTIPSYRELRLAEMQRDESALLVALRESNTLTARSYRRGRSDSFFLFFTDDAPALRPVFGVFNLAAGIGESVWGLVRLPLDGGETLLSGLEGALVSLPELAFWNIRKGTNDWVPPSALRSDVDR